MKLLLGFDATDPPPPPVSLRLELSQIALRKQRARQLATEGHYRRAYRDLLWLSERIDDDADIFSNFGGVCFHLHLFDQALIALNHCLNLDSDHLFGLINSGHVQMALGRADLAELLYRKALALSAEQPIACAGLAHVLIRTERIQEAFECCEHALQHSPDHYPLLLHKAEACLLLRQHRDAIQILNRALTLAPQGSPVYAQGLLQMGACLVAYSSPLQAVDYLRAALALVPRSGDAWNLLGLASRDLADTETARSAFHAAWRYSHSYADAINFYLVQPSFVYDRQTLDRYRRRYFRGLVKLKRLDLAPLCKTEHHWYLHPFNLAYQPGSMKAAMQGFADVIKLEAARRRPDLFMRPRPRCQPRPDGRLRLVFVSDFFYGHSNQRAFEGLIRYIDRDRFDVVVAHGTLSVHDAVRDRIDGYASSVVHLSSDVADCVQTLEQVQPDILFYTDLGMSPFMHILAQVRIAPLQVTSWGLPYTSGIESIDCYLSSALTEPRDAQRDYVEHLHCLSRLPCVYLQEHLAEPVRSREYFFLEEGVFLFGCLQNTIKYHPDFDWVLERVAQRCPDARFVVAEDAKTVHTMLLLDRLSQTAPTFYERIHLVSMMKRDDFISLCACLDVIIDPPYFGSGISFYESIYAGTPTVSLKGGQMRSRYLAGAYSLMGIDPAPVAEDLEGFAQVCVDLCHGPGRLAELRSQINAGKHFLYDDRTCVQEIEDVLIKKALAI